MKLSGETGHCAAHNRRGCVACFGVPKTQVSVKPGDTSCSDVAGVRSLRAQKILDMRDNQRLSFRVIGERVGINPQSVAETYKREKQRLVGQQNPN